MLLAGIVFVGLDLVNALMAIPPPIQLERYLTYLVDGKPVPVEIRLQRIVPFTGVVFTETSVNWIVAGVAEEVLFQHFPAARDGDRLRFQTTQFIGLVTRNTRRR